ncbi:hypothetical protein AB0V67_33190, partial [Mesorhizobium ciceri]
VASAPSNRAAPYVAPADGHAVFSQPATVITDRRTAFVVSIGMFSGAVLAGWHGYAGGFGGLAVLAPGPLISRKTAAGGVGPPPPPHPDFPRARALTGSGAH